MCTITAGVLGGARGRSLTVSLVRQDQSLIAQLAFPAPKMDYNFYATGGAGRLDVANGVIYPALLTRHDTTFLTTSEGEHFPAIHIQMPGARHTILYSHGNGEDIGIVMDQMDDLAQASFNALLTLLDPILTLF